MTKRMLAGNLFLLAAIITEVAATLSLKAAAQTPWLFTVVVSGYGASFVFLALTLRNGKGVGVAYGVWGACGVVLTALASRWLFAEQISLTMAFGFVCVACGVIIVEFGSELHRRRSTVVDVDAQSVFTRETR